MGKGVAVHRCRTRIQGCLKDEAKGKDKDAIDPLELLQPRLRPSPT